MSIVEVQVMELKIYIIALTFPQLLCDVVFIQIFFLRHCIVQRLPMSPSLEINILLDSQEENNCFPWDKY